VAIAGEFVSASLLDGAAHSLQSLALAREDLDAILRQQLYDEVGVRGYVATGDRSFLEQGSPRTPYRVHAQRLRATLVSVGLVDAVASVDRFRRLRTTWVTGVEQPLLHDPHRADAVALEHRSKSLLTAMRDAALTVRIELHGADADIAEKLRFRITVAVGASIVTITLFAMGAVILALSRRETLAALVREQSLVTALQQTLRVAGVELPRTAVGYAYTSATREALIGGDLIDTWQSGGERGWLLIADASGKGVDAARLSAFVQYAIRTLCAEYDDPALVLTRFNELFLSTFTDPSSFVVVFLGRFDAPSATLRYASAGHSGAFIVRAAHVEQLGPTGPIIGLDRGEAYGQRQIVLASGETIVLATDGLTESRDASGAMLGDDGVMARLRTASAAPQAICDDLVDEAQRRANGEVKDDLAILVLRILEPNVPGNAIPFSTLSA